MENVLTEKIDFSRLRSEVKAKALEESEMKMKEVIKDEMSRVSPEVSDKEEVKLEPLKVNKIKFPEIKDTTGKMSEQINKIELATGIKVLPFEVTQIIPCVTELASHRIITIDGKKFTSGYKETNREDIVREFALDVVNQFAENNEPITVNLMTDAEVNNHKFITYIFNEIELRMLLGYLEDFNPKLETKISNGHLTLTIGNFFNNLD